MTTLNNINTIFENIATAHLQLNGFLIVQDFDINPQEELKYPCLAINPITALMPNENQNYSSLNVDYTLKVFDLVDKGLENENDVLSDTLSITKDIVKFLNQNPAYYDANLNIIGDVSFNTIRRAFDEDVTGWETTFTLEFPAGMGYCGTPIENVPTPPVSYVTVTDALNVLSPLEINPGGSYTCTAAGAASGITYLRPSLTGEVIDYGTGSDGANLIAGVYDYTQPPYPISYASLNTTALVPFTTLISNNAFGTKERFTNSLGLTATYDGSNGELINYVIDHLSGLGYIITPKTSTTWSLALSITDSLTEVTFSDWRVSNVKELESIFDYSLNGLFLNYTPFNYALSTEMQTATTASVVTSFYWYVKTNGVSNVVAKTGTRSYMICRNHY